jgi:hypothetical protein
MKLQLDLEKKIIRIEEKVNLKELFNNLNKLFPKKEWEEFDLETNTKIEWQTNPIIIREYEPYRYPWNQPPLITYDTNNSDNFNESNIFNIKLEQWT